MKSPKPMHHHFVREMVSDKVSLLAADESFVYDGLSEYPRHVVKHSAKQYVVGAVHTNTIEAFWSIFKRGIVGTFHKVSAKYMPLYVAEFQFRYNHRRNADIFGSAIEGVLIKYIALPRQDKLQEETQEWQQTKEISNG